MGALGRFFDSKFIGCMIVGVTHDPHRNRTVTLYALHDEPGMVGIYDGIDRWATSASTNPFGLGADKALAEIEKGMVFEIEYGQTMRREGDAPGMHPIPNRIGTYPSKPRRMAHIAQPPKERRRASIQR